MDLARAPCRAPLTARKKGSGYENGVGTRMRLNRNKFETKCQEITFENIIFI